MEPDELSQATERLNAGAEVAPIDPLLLEHLWEAISTLPKGRENTAIGPGAFVRAHPDTMPQRPDQHIALMVRSAILTALTERGLLGDYMQDESRRKHVFAALAAMPCDKKDLAEALMPKLLKESPPEMASKTEREMREAGYDPEHPKIVEKLLSWMREHS